MSRPKILAFTGSGSRPSLNRQLLDVAVKEAVRAGAEVTVLDLLNYPVPIYTGELEAREGVPANARKLKAIFGEHEGLLIASPEHNGSIPALLKNALDWVSRPDLGQNGLVPYQNKVAALLSASPGNLGGLRGLMQLRHVLQSLGVLVQTKQYALARAHEAFDEEGRFLNPRQHAAVVGVVQQLLTLVRALKAVREDG
ncbi:MAG: NAD(P)H-dependent oxidoreductase [Pseudomonadota bacterium]|nr:MAG: NADPH-dependent FMN reductase [Pseudomonadota bacterium]